MPGPLTIGVFAQTSGVTNRPSATLAVPAGYKIVSGGALVNAGHGPGNMLIASYPASATTWFAQSKDVDGKPDPRSITAYAVAIFDPDDLFDVQIAKATSNVASRPAVTATVAADYVLTGGGAMTTAGVTGAGNFLTASYPAADVQWRASSKDHVTANPSSITAYAIGLTSLVDSRLPPFTLAQAVSASANHPAATAPVSSTSVVLGGGALDAFKGAGNMLVASCPVCTLMPGGAVQPCSTPTGWTVSGQDYATSDPSTITAYLIEMNTSF